MIIKAYRSINRLKQDWEYLYLTSDTVSNPFQSFIPNKVYYDAFYLGISRMFLRPLFILSRQDSNELILPIIVDRRKKRITEFAPLDYYDVLYSGSLDLLVPTLDWIIKSFPGYTLAFSRINQAAALSCLKDSWQNNCENCVQIPLDKGSYDDYYLSISKHQRQNLRTAYNKLAKEGISISLSHYDNGTLPRKLRKRLQCLYESRKAAKNASSLIKRVYNRISKPVFKILTKMESGATYVLYLDNVPAAVMMGAFTKNGDKFVVPILYSNNDYLRYSPGIILINEVIKGLITDDVKALDLARGDEAYKYAMGGITHLNYTVIHHP